MDFIICKKYNAKSIFKSKDYFRSNILSINDEEFIITINNKSIITGQLLFDNKHGILYKYKINHNKLLLISAALNVYLHIIDLKDYSYKFYM